MSETKRLGDILWVLAIVMAAPALVLCAVADKDPGISLIVRMLHSPPIAFYVVAIISYTAAIAVVRPDVSLLRCLSAAGWAAAIVVVWYTLTLPLHFATANMSKNEVIVFNLLLACIVALPVSIVHHYNLRGPYNLLGGAKARVEVPAHLALAVLGSLLLSFAQPAFEQHRLYHGILALIATLPLVASVTCRTWERAPRSHAMLAIAVTVLPIYFMKAWSDHLAERSNAFAWPLRVVQEYMPEQERRDLYARVTRIRKGEPVRIGEKWYAFDRFTVSTVHANHWRPDRITRLQIDIPAEDLGLHPFLGSPPHRVPLNISATRFQHSFYLTTKFEDLDIGIVVDRRDDRWPADDAIREKIATFMASRRAPAPSRR